MAFTHRHAQVYPYSSADPSMGRTVGSQITLVHLFNLGVALQLSRAKGIKPWTNTSLTGCTNSPLEVAEIHWNKLRKSRHGCLANFRGAGMPRGKCQ
jgi:hypothetical protein